MNSDRDLVPVWTNYRGRSSVCCKGKLVSARCDCNGIGVLCFTVAIITFPSISFLSFDCIILAERLSVVVPIVAVAFIIFTLSTLLRAALMDPGIIPRATPYEAWWIENCITEAPADTPGTMRPPPRTRDVMVMGQSMKLKYCNTCKLFRPPRASHCSMCDNCIDRFDHHCPWVGNCVGRRNYRYFYLFLLSVFAYSCYVFSMSVLTMILLIQEKKDFVDAWKRSPFSVIEALIAFFSILSIIGLGGFHTYLIGNEVSTNEDIKGVFKKSLDPKIVNPFHRGNFLANFAYILCGPTPTSLLLMKEPAYNPSQMEQIRQAFHVKPQMTSNDALTMVSVDRQNDNVSNSDSSSLQVPILSPTKTHKDPIHDNVTYGSISHSILPME